MNGNGNFVYDGTIEGFLTVVAYCISNKIMPLHILNRTGLNDIPAGYVNIRSNFDLADKTYRMIGRRSSPEVQQLIGDFFLTCVPEMEKDLFILVCKAIKYGAIIAEDYSDDLMRRVQFSIRDLYREAQSALNDIGMLRNRELSYAMIDPRNNVLPLISSKILKDPDYDDILIYDKRHMLVLVRIRDRDAIVDTRRISHTVLRTSDELYTKLWPYFHEEAGVTSYTRSGKGADSLTRLWYIAG